MKKITHVSMFLDPTYRAGNYSGDRITVFIYRGTDNVCVFSYRNIPFANARFNTYKARFNRSADVSHCENYATGSLHYQAYFNNAPHGDLF